MPRKSKCEQTSTKVGSTASTLLRSPTASSAARSVAGSALTQRPTRQPAQRPQRPTRTRRK